MTSSEHTQDRSARWRLLHWAGLVGFPEPGDAQVPLSRQICRGSEGRLITASLFVVVGLAAYPFAITMGEGAGTAQRVQLVGVAALLVGLFIGALRTSEIHPRWFDGLPVVIAALLAGGVAAAQPYGGVIAPLVTFLGPTIAFVISSRPRRIPHAIVASVLVLLPVITWTGTPATLAATLMAWSAACGLGMFVALVWDGADRQTRRLEQLVRADPLTGVGNRRLLDERLRYEIRRHRRSRRRFALVVLDLNGFKEINDTLGHHAGDAILQRVASALQDAVREQDTVTRAGGDEFCVLLPETEADGAQAFVGALHTALARLDAEGRPVAAAIGTAVFPDDADDPAGLFEAADARQREDKALPHVRSAVQLGGDGHEAARRALRLPGLRLLADDLQDAFLAAGPGADGRGETVVRRITRLRSVRLAVSFVFAWASAMCLLGALWWFDGRTTELLACAGLALGTAVAVALVPTDTMHPRWFHGLPLLVTAELAVAIVVLDGDAYAAFPAVAFLGAAIAFVLDSVRAIAVHLVVATVVLGAAVLSVGTGPVLAGGATMLAVLLWNALYVELTWRIADEQSEHLGELMRRDPLTGAGNRRLLTERVDYELHRHHRTGRPLTVFALDLNGFKRINDTLGHAAGDDLLRAAAAALRRAVREQDTVIRQGGDEFLLIAPETGPNQARTLARGIRAALAQVDADGEPLTAAIGVATFPDDGVSAADLAHTADIRQLADKPHGAARGAARRATS